MFYDRLLELCKNENKKITPVIQELGLSTGGIARWRNGSAPDGDTLYKIAEYFNVSVDYLLGLTDQKEKPSADGEHDELDNEIIKLFSSLSDEKKKAALNYIAFLTQQENGEN